MFPRPFTTTTKLLSVCLHLSCPPPPSFLSVLSAGYQVKVKYTGVSPGDRTDPSPDVLNLFSLCYFLFLLMLMSLLHDRDHRAEIIYPFKDDVENKQTSVVCSLKAEEDIQVVLCLLTSNHHVTS